MSIFGSNELFAHDPFLQRSSEKVRVSLQINAQLMAHTPSTRVRKLRRGDGDPEGPTPHPSSAWALIQLYVQPWHGGPLYLP